MTHVAPSPQRFADGYGFPLDDFQRRAIEALAQGESVLVAAPTGAGKTVVAEYAIEVALGGGRKCFYTTPLKALSNQKFGDLVARHGADAIGLLTGDNAINADAQIVVMTTEVLRNMLYAGSRSLEGLQTVVMDEVHYLQDPYRGAVWEEVLIHLPLSVGVVCLSATISNAEEFGEWVGTLRGPTRVVIEERRPVPLQHHYLVGRELHAMHVERDGQPAPNPHLVALDREEQRRRAMRPVGPDGARRRRGGRARRPAGGVRVATRDEVVEVLEQAGMLPAIYFVFSRNGCDRSVGLLLESGLRLTSREEAERIRDFVELRAAWIPDEDLVPLGYPTFAEALSRGIAAHHAGMLPVFKETVEELFEEGLVRVVFATETLALGVNMPARTVVIEDLWKFQGERHELLTPGEYTQLAGRAGRRGIDPIGNSVVLFQRQVAFDRVASLASTRTYELASSFRPSYNMAVNLARNYTREQAHHLLNSSFAQFLADRSVVALERQVERDRTSASELRSRARCELGDFDAYWEMRREALRLRDAARDLDEKARQVAVRDALASLRPGDVVHVPTARRRGLAVVLSVREGRPTVLAQDRTYFRLSAVDFRHPPAALTRIPLPRTGSARSARFRRDLAATLLALDLAPGQPAVATSGAVAEAEEIEARAAQHPCAACPDLADHERWAARADASERQVSGATARIRSRTETLARQLDRVLGVLQELGHVEDFTVLPKGEILSRIYGEADILVAEAIASGVFEGLAAEDTAALVSSLVYETRERFPRQARMPTQETRSRFASLEAIHRIVRRAEQRHHVELCRDLDAGFGETIHAWARGASLDDVLSTTGLAPGDFVRTCKQLLDLLRQIEDVAPAPTAEAVRGARAAVERGVVAYTGV